MSHRIGIALLGKGATNHLHLQVVVEAFRSAGVEPCFLVRDDYMPILKQIEGCEHHPVSISSANGWRAQLVHFLESVRGLYPSTEPGRYLRTPTWRELSLPGKISFALRTVLGRFLWVSRLAIRLEARLLEPGQVQGLDDVALDQVLVLGVNTGVEGIFSRWAQSRGLSVVHYVGNYDNLSSKGFRAVDVSRLLVWGPSMLEDAQTMQGVPASRVSVTGALRYNNTMVGKLDDDRAGFLEGLGLDPAKRTLLYAGGMMEDACFEMLEVYRLLREEREDVQLILRLYPNKRFMDSVQVPLIIRLADSLPGVYVSLGDPHYRSGRKTADVLHVEEYELVNALKACDVVINHFSTIAVEASIFDKPALQMWYFLKPNGAMRFPPVYLNWPSCFHTRRLLSYGATPVVESREALMDGIREALDEPAKRAAEF